MAPLRKHGYHQVALDLPALAAGSAADTSTLFTYLFNASNLGGVDPALDYVRAAALTFDAAVSAVATNNFQVNVSHYNSAGTLVDQVTYANATTGITASAVVPIDLGGAISGNVHNPTGASIQAGWSLLPGDSIVVKRASNGTGQASPAFTVTLGVGSKA